VFDEVSAPFEKSPLLWTMRTLLRQINQQQDRLAEDKTGSILPRSGFDSVASIQHC
jgi:hypothetical protein